MLISMSISFEEEIPCPGKEWLSYPSGWLVEVPARQIAVVEERNHVSSGSIEVSCELEESRHFFPVSFLEGLRIRKQDVEYRKGHSSIKRTDEVKKNSGKSLYILFQVKKRQLMNVTCQNFVRPFSCQYGLHLAWKRTGQGGMWAR